MHVEIEKLFFFIANSVCISLSLFISAFIYLFIYIYVIFLSFIPNSHWFTSWHWLFLTFGLHITKLRIITLVPQHHHPVFAARLFLLAFITLCPLTVNCQQTFWQQDLRKSTLLVSYSTGQVFSFSLRYTSKCLQQLFQPVCMLKVEVVTFLM